MAAIFKGRAVTAGLGALLAMQSAALAAELSVGDLAMRPDSVSEVIVSGTIRGESTYGVTIMVELVPRAKSTGTVTFTVGLAAASLRPARTFSPVERGVIPAPPITERAHAADIVPLRDPWPRRGTCTLFDTDESDSVWLNGLVDDNGTYVPAPLVFSGELVSFPIVATFGAEGVWDVLLSTVAGASVWEGVATTLHAGTITVTSAACVEHGDCLDGDPCTKDACSAGRCVYSPQGGGKCLEAAEPVGAKPPVLVDGNEEGTP